MKLELLSYGDATHVSDYIQHISNLINHEILPKETFQEHFDRLLARVDNNLKEAVKAFVDMQDKGILKSVIWELYNFEDPESSGRIYHNFNFYKGK